jgi:glycerol-3-phosphate dehydrogenase
MHTDILVSFGQGLARNHIITISDSKLLTIAGGKWTTYRLLSYLLKRQHAARIIH